MRYECNELYELTKRVSLKKTGIGQFTDLEETKSSAAAYMEVSDPGLCTGSARGGTVDESFRKGCECPYQSI